MKMNRERVSSASWEGRAPDDVQLAEERHVDPARKLRENMEWVVVDLGEAFAAEVERRRAVAWRRAVVSFGEGSWRWASKLQLGTPALEGEERKVNVQHLIHGPQIAYTTSTSEVSSPRFVPERKRSAQKRTSRQLSHRTFWCRTTASLIPSELPERLLPLLLRDSKRAGEVGSYNTGRSWRRGGSAF